MTAKLKRNRKLNDRQSLTIRLIGAAQAQGEPIDLDQLLENMPEDVSKESYQFTIRSLISRDLITKAGKDSRRGRSRVIFELTEAGRVVYDPRAGH